MKLASYRDGSRDGQLVVVSRDLATAHYATGIATRLQQVLDDWNFLSPQLEALSQNLNHGKARHAFPFDPDPCGAPLPRAFQWLSPERPSGADAGRLRLRRGASDSFLAPRDALPADADGRLDIEAGLAVVVGDVEAGVAPASAIDGIRLVMLAATVVDRETDLDIGTAFSPVAATPDEFGVAWQGGRLDLNLEVHWNGKRLARLAAANGLQPHFGDLIAAAAARRGLAAGSIVGGGAGGADAGRDEAKTPFARPGDRMRIDMKGADGQSVFGAIDLQATGANAD